MSALLFSFNGWADEIEDPLEGFATPVEDDRPPIVFPESKFGGIAVPEDEEIVDPFDAYTLACRFYSDATEFALIIYPRSNHLKFGHGRYEIKWSNAETYTKTGNEFSASVLNTAVFIKHNLLSDTGTFKIDRITSKYHCPTKIDGAIES